MGFARMIKRKNSNDDWSKNEERTERRKECLANAKRNKKSKSKMQKESRRRNR